MLLTVPVHSICPSPFIQPCKVHQKGIIALSRIQRKSPLAERLKKKDEGSHPKASFDECCRHHKRTIKVRICCVITEPQRWCMSEYIYKYTCVCVCVCRKRRRDGGDRSRTSAIRPNQSGDVAGNEGLGDKALHAALDCSIKSSISDICADRQDGGLFLKLRH